MPKISIPLGPQQYALDTVFAGQAEFVAYRYCQKRRRRISTKKILLPKVNFIKLFTNQNFIFQFFFGEYRVKYRTYSVDLNVASTFLTFSPRAVMS